MLCHKYSDRDKIADKKERLAIDRSQTSGPRYPQYIHYVDRVDSFDNWPVGISMRPNRLAAAGFFYLGTSDRTCCYFCGIVLKHWVPHDDPFEEHAKWLSACCYLRTYRTAAFIERMKKKPMNSMATFSSVYEEINDNRSMDDNYCKICYVNKRNVAFIPCGHVLACTTCGLMMERCPSCRGLIDKQLRLYFC